MLFFAHLHPVVLLTHLRTGIIPRYVYGHVRRI
jgi:hypothetical protein